MKQIKKLKTRSTKTIDNRYEELNQLGKGGIGEAINCSIASLAVSLHLQYHPSKTDSQYRPYISILSIPAAGLAILDVRYETK